VPLDSTARRAYSLDQSKETTLKIKEPEMIYKSGKPTAVILPLADYEELLERVEDADDLQWLKKARGQGVSYRPFSDYLKDHKKRVSGRH
jgi:hypothetical protein